MKIGKHLITFTLGNIQLSKHKFLEYQLDRKFATDPFDFHVWWDWKGDHAGPGFYFSIYKLFWFQIKIYDHRHWDYENNCWENK